MAVRESTASTTPDTATDSFDVKNAENIEASRTIMNLYWDCANGLRTHEENSRFPTFTSTSGTNMRTLRRLYRRAKCAEYQGRHAKRNRTVDDLLADVRICPGRNDLPDRQGGRLPAAGDAIGVRAGVHGYHRGNALAGMFMCWTGRCIWTRPAPTSMPVRYSTLKTVTARWNPRRKRRWNSWVYRCRSRDKKPSKVNNRKVAFDGICRSYCWVSAGEHGLEVETEAILAAR